jgi:hypothetical protein
MVVNDTIVPASEPISALIVHSTENDLGQNISDYVTANLDSGIAVQIEHVASYGDLIDTLEKAKPFHVFIFIAHGDKATHSAWLCGDLDADGKELSLGVAEQVTLKDYLVNKVCIFGVCYFGAQTLAQAVVAHDGAIFALASNPDNSLTGLDVARAAIGLLNAMEQVKPCDITLDLLTRLCVPKIDHDVLDRMEQFRP